ncbi:MAG: transporter [Cellulosimicrobium sp.]|nr:transporter [Cellulosimicrobium sp.]
MNFLPGEVSGGTITLPFGEFDMPESIASAVGDRGLVIVGLRPEHFEDARLVDPSKKDRGHTFEAQIDVTEWLGAELYAYVPFEMHESVKGQLEELDRELDGEGLRTQFVVALDSASRVRDGDVTDLWFDPTKMMIFDPETSENLTRDDAEAERIETENAEDRKRSLERAQKQDAQV